MDHPENKLSDAIHAKQDDLILIANNIDPNNSRITL